jgi:DNA-binding NarL/FixJ family response regulator
MVRMISSINPDPYNIRLVAKGQNRLTDREKKAVYYLLQGMNSKEGAFKLGVSESAFGNILQAVRGKYGARDTNGLIALFFPLDREFWSEKLNSKGNRIARLLVRGESTEAIATEFGCSKCTLSTYCGKYIYRKLGIRSRIELGALHYRELLRNPFEGMPKA